MSVIKLLTQIRKALVVKLWQVHKIYFDEERVYAY